MLLSLKSESGSEKSLESTLERAITIAVERVQNEGDKRKSELMANFAEERADGFKQFQAAADLQMRRVARDYDRIVTWTGLALVVIASLATLLGIKAFYDLKQTAIKSVHLPAAQEAAKAQNTAENVMARPLAAPGLPDLMTAKTTEGVTMSEKPLSDAQWRLVIVPALAAISNEVTMAEKEIAHAQAHLSDIRASRDFMLTVLSAMSDDRDAYETLYQLSRDASSPFRKTADDAYRKICLLDSRLGEGIQVAMADSWRNAADASYCDLRAYSRHYATCGTASQRIKLIVDVCHRKDISNNDKISWFMDIYAQDKSLAVVATVGRLVHAEPGADYEPLAIRDILDWWSSNKEKYRGSDQTSREAAQAF